jgi:hypothetical protein
MGLMLAQHALRKKDPTIKKIEKLQNIRNYGTKHAHFFMVRPCSSR